MTTDRDVEVAERLATLEADVKAIQESIKNGMAFWRNLAGSVTGGIIVAAVIYLLRLRG